MEQILKPLAVLLVGAAILGAVAVGLAIPVGLIF
jgi:hypothetical protein|tara:strand:+ start:391 stop:492 length:102 start_codon:yes stop_codon:yes gene_type:complete